MTVAARVAVACALVALGAPASAKEHIWLMLGGRTIDFQRGRGFVVAL